MCIIKLILWLLTAVCVGLGVLMLDSWICVLFFLAAFLLMPLPKLRHFIEKFIGETLRAILIIALIAVALGCVPQVREWIMSLIP